MTDIRFFRVGGFVRDQLLGIGSKDIDFAVEAPSFEAMAAAVEARCTRVFVDTDGNYIGQQFFTIRGIEPELGAVDFVLCRKDGPSSDGRRPDFVEPGTILDDLARRDFTVNAMALTDDGALLDPHGGLADLESRTLRFVGNAKDRLTEDALRAFRGIRFEITKGFKLSPDASMAINTMFIGDFEAVSTDRIRDELVRCFAFDTRETLFVLSQFPLLLNLALDRGIWLKPTSEAP
jgi:tRNA nucleotidyltransferase/poly(A) polymerase